MNKTKFAVDKQYLNQANEYLNSIKNAKLEGVYYLNAGDIRLWYRDENGKLNSILLPARKD